MPKEDIPTSMPQAAPRRRLPAPTVAAIFSGRRPHLPECRDRTSRRTRRRASGARDRSGGFGADDVIVLDVFDHLLTVPWTLVTVEALAAMRALLTPDGFLVLNVLTPLDGRGVGFLQRFLATVEAVFPAARGLSSHPRRASGSHAERAGGGRHRRDAASGRSARDGMGAGKGVLGGAHLEMTVPASAACR